MSRFVVRLAVATLFASTALLQAQDSQVTGRITDPSQAVVAAARATLTRTESGDRREAASNAEGYYTFPLIRPGIYELTVQKEGFHTKSLQGIRVETGQIANLNVSLELGEISQSVNVDAAVPVLQTENAAVSSVVTNESINKLPLIDRRSVQLIRLNGFTVQRNSGQGVSFAVAGGRGSSSNYFVDGGTVQNVALGDQGIYFDPPVEALQEFNVNVSTFSAEYGRTGSAVIQMTTKSGANNFHGTGYEYFRNDALNANTYFARVKPVLRYNLFGANFSGPIKRNKTWFFFNYEGRLQKQGDTKSLTLPTPAEARGDFSADSFIVRDPVTNNPFPNNIIPANRLDPVGVKLASFYPAPNVNTPGAINYIRNSPNETTVNNYVARVDHVFGSNDRLMARFLGQPNDLRYGGVFPTAGTDPFGYLTHEYYYNWGGSWAHTFSPTIYNELRGNISQRQRLSISDSANTELGAQVGLKGVPRQYFPSVTVAGYAVLGDGAGAPNGNGQFRSQTPVGSHLINDTVTMIKGKHQVRFGGEYRFGSSVDQAASSAGGALSFNNQVTGNAVAALLLGWVNSGSVSLSDQLHSRLDTYAAFIQDDWHVLPNLTLNLGLRYDLDSPRTDANGKQNGFDPNAINPVSGTRGVITFAAKGANKYANRWDANNFGPRIGFAWKPANNWVIRGGGAILYNASYGLGSTTVLFTGFSTQGSFTSSNNGRTPAFLLNDGFPALSYSTPDSLTPGYGAVRVGQAPTTSFQWMQPDRSTGYVYQSSFNIQRQLGTNMIIEAAYLGTFGQHLSGSAGAAAAPNINQVPTALLGAGNLQSLRPYPQFGDILLIGADFGRSNYHGVNLGFDRRFARGFQFKVNYTYSKFFDNIPSQDLGTTTALTNYYDRSGNYGLSGNDLRNRVIVASTYELPVGSGKLLNTASSKLLTSIIGGWSINGIGEFYTGSPLSPTELTNATNSYSTAVRPNVVGDPNISGDRSRTDQLARWFNTAAFAAPAPYTFGNAGRSFGTGPNSFSMDGSLMKSFSFEEHYRAEFRAEVLNLTNHANFANPNTQRGSPSFGQVTALALGNQARIIQLGVRLQF